MLHPFKTVILSLQFYKDFPLIETKILISLSLLLKSSTFRVHFKPLYTVLRFNLAQFSLITDNPKQLLLEKLIRYLHLEHYKPKNRTHIKLPKNYISVRQGTVTSLSKSKLK